MPYFPSAAAPLSIAAEQITAEVVSLRARITELSQAMLRMRWHSAAARAFSGYASLILWSLSTAADQLDEIAAQAQQTADRVRDHALKTPR